MLTIQNAGCIRFILQSSDRSKTIRKELDPRKPVNRRRDANQNVIKKSHRRSERRTENSFFFPRRYCWLSRYRIEMNG